MFPRVNFIHIISERRQLVISSVQFSSVTCSYRLPSACGFNFHIEYFQHLHELFHLLLNQLYNLFNINISYFKYILNNIDKYIFRNLIINYPFGISKPIRVIGFKI